MKEGGADVFVPRSGSRDTVRRRSTTSRLASARTGSSLSRLLPSSLQPQATYPTPLPLRNSRRRWKSTVSGVIAASRLAKAGAAARERANSTLAAEAEAAQQQGDGDSDDDEYHSSASANGDAEAGGLAAGVEALRV